MKKFFLVTITAFTATFAIAQDLDEIKTMAYLNQTAKAKEAIDKFLAVEKNAKKPEGWFYKGYILNQMSKDTAKSIDENSAIKTEAFEALKKYRQMDPKAPLLDELANSPIYDLYSGFAWDLAIKAYQAKNSAGAYDNFKKGGMVYQYCLDNNLVFNNGYKCPPLDTTIVFYTGIAANDLKKMDEAATYYRRLTDAGLGGSDYADIYPVLLGHYKEKKDKASFNDILTKARKLYPEKETTWSAYEIEEAINGIAKPALFDKYDELLAKRPNDYDLAYNYYGVDLYNYLLSDEGKATANNAALKAKLVEVMKKVIAIKSTFDANYLLSNFMYNNSFDISEEARKIKSVKPDEIKKKKALEAEATKQMDESLPYAETAETAFKTIDKPKTIDKVHYKSVLTMIRNVYETRKNVAKVAVYDKLIKAAE